jgi:hypothetical protein
MEDAHAGGADRRGARVIERGCFLKTAGVGGVKTRAGIKQRAVDAPWELAGGFEAGLWHECGTVFEAHMLRCCE